MMSSSDILELAAILVIFLIIIVPFVWVVVVGPRSLHSVEKKVQGVIIDAFFSVLWKFFSLLYRMITFPFSIFRKKLKNATYMATIGAYEYGYYDDKENYIDVDTLKEPHHQIPKGAKIDTYMLWADFHDPLTSIKYRAWLAFVEFKAGWKPPLNVGDHIELIVREDFRQFQVPNPFPHYVHDGAIERLTNE